MRAEIRRLKDALLAARAGTLLGGEEGGGPLRGSSAGLASARSSVSCASGEAADGGEAAEAARARVRALENLLYQCLERQAGPCMPFLVYIYTHICIS
jgi:hypothetical protein